MNWLSRLISDAPQPELDAAQRDALARWQQGPAPDIGRPHFETRYVVVNTEATGLDPDRDRVLAIGAIALESGTLDNTRSLYRPLGPDPLAALLELLAFIGRDPVVVFNANFNQLMLQRLLHHHLGIEPEWLWLDVYWLLGGLFNEKISGPAKLVDWMKAFDIETFQRHHALGDAYAIAQLMLAVQGRALRRGLPSARSLAELERHRRQMGGLG